MPRIIYPSSNQQYTKGDVSQARRIFLLTAVVTLLFIIIIGRLFQLQVIKASMYSQMASDQHYGAITLNAKRGEILVRDTNSGDLSKLATNTTLELVYVDPFVVQDKVDVAKKLAPLLFTQKEYDTCVAEPDKCVYDVSAGPDINSSQIVETSWAINKDDTGNKDATVEIKSSNSDIKTFSQMVDEVAARILRKISKSEQDL